MKLQKSYGRYSLIFLIAVIAAVNAFAVGLPWKDHDKPFDFVFDNHFDSHQQSKVHGDGETLTGFFYITYTGGTTDDLPNARHGTETAGWSLKGVPAYNAVVLDTSGLHPIWCVDPNDVPSSPGYSHFHWFGEPQSHTGLSVGEMRDGYLLKLTAIDAFYFEHGPFPVTPGIDDVSHYNIVVDYEGDGCTNY